jgi:hypothetical protein
MKGMPVIGSRNINCPCGFTSNHIWPYPRYPNFFHKLFFLRARLGRKSFSEKSAYLVYLLFSMACAGIRPRYHRATGRLPPSRPSRGSRPTRDCGEAAAAPRGEKDIGARSSRTSSPLTCSSLPRSRAGHDPSGAATPARIGQAQAPIGALPRSAGDASTGRSRPQSQGGSQPPRSNGQAFDEARNPVTVAGRRRYKASVPAHPCWDQAVPGCSPLTGWAPGPVAASRPSGAAASNYLSEDGKAPPGSTHWQNYFPAPSGSGWDDETPPCRVRWRAHDDALAALLRSPTVQLPQGSPRKEGHSFLPRPLDQNPGPWVWDWLVAPRLARRAQARQSPRRRPRDALFSSVTSDDFASSLNLTPVRC